jgi:hypothetical protein
MAKETAEQKLLKIIEGSSAGASKKAVVSRKKAKGDGISIKQVNQILVVGIVLCLGMLIYEINSGITLLNSQFKTDDLGASSRRTAEFSVPQVQSLAYYADAMSARNIFKPYDQEQGMASEPEVVTLEQRMSRYRVVGVAWLDLPESASLMVEDIETRKTYFLREGEKIDDVTVTTIYTDRAVFSYENEEIVIKL